jgi:hypothetical protein
MHRRCALASSNDRRALLRRRGPQSDASRQTRPGVAELLELRFGYKKTLCSRRQQLASNSVAQSAHVASCGKYDRKDQPACRLYPRRTARGPVRLVPLAAGSDRSAKRPFCLASTGVRRGVLRSFAMSRFAESGRFRAEPSRAWKPVAPTDHRDEPLRMRCARRWAQMRLAFVRP